MDTFVSTIVDGRVAVAKNFELTSEIDLIDVASGAASTISSLDTRVLALALGRGTDAIYYLTTAKVGVELRRYDTALGADASIDTWVADSASGPGEFGILVAVDGSRVVEQFCGARCQLRSLDLASGVASELTGVNGPAIAVTSDAVFAMSVSDGTGDLVRARDNGIIVLAAGIGAARAVSTTTGELAIVCIRVANEFEVTIVDSDGVEVRPRWSVPLGQAGQAPFDLVGSSRDHSADAIADGYVVLMPGGRLVSPISSRGVILPVDGGQPIDFGVTP